VGIAVTVHDQPRAPTQVEPSLITNVRNEDGTTTADRSDPAVSERTGRLRRRIWSVITTCLFLGVVALWEAAHGGYGVWVQNFGTPAHRVEIMNCSGGSHRSRIVSRDCTGKWHQDDGNVRTVTVHGTNSLHINSYVDVHVRGDQAYTDSIEQVVRLLAGCGLLGLTVVIGLRTARRSPNSRNTRVDDPETFLAEDT
jgi:hypothetical protein